MVFHVDGEDDAVGEHVRDCAGCGRYRDEVAAERLLLRRALAKRETVARPAARRLPVWPFAAAALAAVVAYAALHAPPRVGIASKPAPAVTPVEPPPAPPEVEVPTPIPEPPKPKEPAPPRAEPLPPVPVKPPPEPPRVAVEVPAPPPAPPKPTEPAPVARPGAATLLLAKGLPKGPKWEGWKTFADGDSFRARTAMRIDWGGAAVCVKENSTVVVRGERTFDLEGGEVLVESAGVKLSIRAAGTAYENTGTRFLVATDGRQSSASVFEGRVNAGGREIVAGERVTLKGGKVVVEPVRDAYPAWAAPALPRKTVLAAFEFKSPDRRYLGAAKDGVLNGVEKGGFCYAGVESDTALLAAPAKGEFRVTLWTDREDPVTLRVRVLKPESTAYDYVLAKPVPGRPVTVRAPLEAFRSFEGNRLAAGDRIHILYVFCRELKSRVRIDDLAILEEVP
jgi:hypothetical protein